MPLMKFNKYFILAFLLTIFAYSANAQSSIPNHGTFKNGIYQSKYFGIKIKIPNNWHLMKKHEQGDQWNKKMSKKNNSQSLFSGDNSEYLTLFMAFQNFHYGSPDFPALKCIAEKVKPNCIQNYKDSFLFAEITKGKTINEEIFSIIIKKYALTFSLLYSTNKDRDILKKLLTNLTFDRKAFSEATKSLKSTLSNLSINQSAIAPPILVEIKNSKVDLTWNELKSKMYKTIDLDNSITGANTIICRATSAEDSHELLYKKPDKIKATQIAHLNGNSYSQTLCQNGNHAWMTIKGKISHIHKTKKIKEILQTELNLLKTFTFSRTFKKKLSNKLYRIDNLKCYKLTVTSSDKKKSTTFFIDNKYYRVRRKTTSFSDQNKNNFTILYNTKYKKTNNTVLTLKADYAHLMTLSKTTTLLKSAFSSIIQLNKPISDSEFEKPV